MLKLNRFTVGILVLVSATFRAGAQENDFLDAIKNLNLQDAATAGSAPSSIPEEEDGQEVSRTALEQKNKQLQRRYDQLLGSYNRIKSRGDAAARPVHREQVTTLTAEKTRLADENATLRKQLSEAGAVTESLQEKLRDLSGRQQIEHVDLKQLTARLTIESEALRNQLTAASQGAGESAREKKEQAVLAQENVRLKTEVESARRAQAQAEKALAELRNGAEKESTERKSELVALGEMNTRLKAQVDEKAAALTAVSDQVAALRREADASGSSLKSELAALNGQNAQLRSDADVVRKKLDESTAALAALRQKTDEAEQVVVKGLKTAKGKNSYSLGVFYYEKINAEFEKIVKNKIDLLPALMIAGVNDAHSGKVKMKKDAIMENVVKIDTTVQSINTDVARKILKQIKDRPYEVLANGSFLVTEKKTATPYSGSDRVTFDMLEKKVGGGSILNTMNTTIALDRMDDALLKKIVTEGGKGGTMSLYGRADVLYKNVPEGVKADSLVSITFRLR